MLPPHSRPVIPSGARNDPPIIPGEATNDSPRSSRAERRRSEVEGSRSEVQPTEIPPLRSQARFGRDDGGQSQARAIHPELAEWGRDNRVTIVEQWVRPNA